MAQAVPLLAAQLVQLLYNVVDRIYIGHLPGIGGIALTGVGLAFPLTTMIAAFTNLYGTGGASLFAIARGARDEKQAERILHQSAFLLLVTSGILFILCYTFRRPVLYLFGASDESYGYADVYLRIYLLGIWFSMFATGLNGFINAQGYPRVGMGTIAVGALMNLILDPVLIFGFHMGVAGAAIATVVSQMASAVWVLCFFRGRRTLYLLKKEGLRFDGSLAGEIVAQGAAAFTVQATNCSVQVACNMMLRAWGGDLYVGVMTVLNSVREIMSLPAHTLTAGAQPVLGFNYGARKYRRVRQGIRFMISAGIIYTAGVWLLIRMIGSYLILLFTDDPAMIRAGADALQIYFYGFIFMSLQFAGQSSFTALRCPKRAIFFSLLRKVVIVVPLTFVLPGLGFGVNGVYLAEPISNLLGGVACFATMWMTLYRKLPLEDEKS